MSGRSCGPPRFRGGSGEVCVVTGATSGIGYETALGLARLGARVIGVGRTCGRCEAAATRIRAETGNDSVFFETADLSRNLELASLAGRIRTRYSPIAVLVNNAGTFSSRRIMTADGIELQFAVNYLAGFHLVARLFTHLAERARIITVSSGSHFAGRIHWNNLWLHPLYNGLTAYAQSKLAEVIFNRELARRNAGGRDLATYAVDPGLVETQIGSKGAGTLVRALWRLRARCGIAPAAAAAPIVRIAAEQAYAGKSGLYWHDGRPVPSSKRSYDPSAGPRLWELSERMCGVRFAGLLKRDSQYSGVIAVNEDQRDDPRARVDTVR